MNNQPDRTTKDMHQITLDFIMMQAENYHWAKDMDDTLRMNNTDLITEQTLASWYQYGSDRFRCYMNSYKANKIKHGKE